MRWYLDLFSSSDPSRQLLMEKSPEYLVRPNTAQMVKGFNPGMRVIFALRDPFVRAVSDFVHEMQQENGYGRARWGEEATFEEVSSHGQ